MDKRFSTALAVAVAAAAMLAPRSAAAFCGFYVSGADTKLYNNATQVVMMRDGIRTVLSMENNYQGPPEDFAMVVPVPVVLREDNVKVLPRAIFERVDSLTAPRLVEYWEQDPCPSPSPASMPGAMMEDSVAYGASPPAPPETEHLHVTIEAKFTVGEYDVLVLGAQDSTGLDTWLRLNNYKIPAGAEPLLRPYVQMGMKFFVAKVNAKKVKLENGMAMLSPLRFHYDSDAFFLPIRLGLVNSPGTQDLIVDILAKNQRFEAANYANVSIPTNLDVTESTRDHFGAMYAALFDQTVSENPHSVVTEYSWAAESCDPCPVEQLSPEELFTLGADVIPSRRDQLDDNTLTSDFVVTRLHARYTKDTVGDDIFFRAAHAIIGGREERDEDGQVSHGATPSGSNNFQARYVVRHPWKGAIACEHPQRGVWGGPPAGDPAPASTVLAASNIAFAPRGNGFQLSDFVKDVPFAAPLSKAGGTPQLAIPKSGGCAGCSTSGGGGVAEGIFGALGIVALLRIGKRRSRTGA